MNQPNASAIRSAPASQLKTNRGLGKVIGLSIVTFGIYALIFYNSLSNDINTIASRYDSKRTMNGILMLFLSPFTLGILALIWNHKLCERIGNELGRRRINLDISTKTFWLWGFVGTLFIVGPLIYLHKLCDAMNKLSEHYNTNG